MERTRTNSKKAINIKNLINKTFVLNQLLQEVETIKQHPEKLTISRVKRLIKKCYDSLKEFQDYPLFRKSLEPSMEYLRVVEKKFKDEN